MKRILFFLVLIVVFSSCKQTDKPKVEQEITEEITKEEALQLLHSWTEAYLNGNAEPLKDILDDSWVYSGSSGGNTSTKIAAIDEFSQADYSFDEIKYHDLDVKLYGNVAVVRGWERMVILSGDKQDTTQLKLRFTDVYQKKEGKVRAISTHSSPMD
ncbi:MAG: nuclear transport factor 2 family protein [Allomuricauda sp.]